MRGDPRVERGLARGAARSPACALHGARARELARGAPLHDCECHEKRGGHGADGEESGRVDEADVRGREDGGVHGGRPGAGGEGRC